MITKKIIVCILFISCQGFTYPLIDRATKTGELKLQVFPDNLVGGLYWYVPTSIEPIVNHGNPMSELYQTRDELLFMFRGQASVDESILSNLAHNLGVPRSNLKPIFYHSNKLSACAMELFDEADIKWMAPKQMGNYMEILPFGVRTRNKQMIPLLSHYFNGKGLGCVYDYEFSAAYTAYKVKVTMNLNRIYTRFQSHAHAEGFWWESDIKLLLEKLQREGSLTIEPYQDPTSPKTPLDEQIQASFDDIVKKVVSMIFTSALKLQDGEIGGRGKPWSLRSDYRQQVENNQFIFNLESQSVQKKSSTISVRLGLQ